MGERLFTKHVSCPFAPKTPCKHLNLFLTTDKETLARGVVYDYMNTGTSREPVQIVRHQLQQKARSSDIFIICYKKIFPNQCLNTVKS